MQGIWQSFTDLNESNQRDEICTKILGGAETCKPNPDAAKFVGLDNYVDILTGQQGSFWLQFTNTLVWTLACVVAPLRPRPGAGRHAQPQLPRPRLLPRGC